MRFSKGHGTGNDFVILPDPAGELPLTRELVAAICDRRRGVGADGVLRVVRSAQHPEAAPLADSTEWFMDYWNSDGSLAEMCGNGVRVFARYLVESGLVRTGGAALPVATRAGVVRVAVDGDTVAVGMRRPRVYAAGEATVGPLTLAGAAVDVGNPHLVCAVPAGLDLADLDLTRAPGYDPALFPDGVNVELTAAGPPVEGADLRVAMRVYERGSTETLSCGTGACAVAAVALRDAGLADGVVAVDLPGGRLTVTIDRAGCTLAGPAVLVASGEIHPAALLGRTSPIPAISQFGSPV